ncbi:hypothetical protein HMPREF9446_02205 [Bacteroides fluxus YIT 12057]|uniref:Uncharacterized protein n=1 Tax=Bacteroides fluxus YIT 12057 TaxID=763034 RepID=F3PTY5_9BACE|nr:hypothetical protein HMPREF9446_02205 [Bacteroides fluxus YIT 12057]
MHLTFFLTEQFLIFIKTTCFLMLWAGAFISKLIVRQHLSF